MNGKQQNFNLYRPLIGQNGDCVLENIVYMKVYKLSSCVLKIKNTEMIN